MGGRSRTQGRYLQLAEDLTSFLDGSADAEKLWDRYPGG